MTSGDDCGTPPGTDGTTYISDEDAPATIRLPERSQPQADHELLREHVRALTDRVSTLETARDHVATRVAELNRRLIQFEGITHQHLSELLERMGALEHRHASTAVAADKALRAAGRALSYAREWRKKLLVWLQQLGPLGAGDTAVSFLKLQVQQWIDSTAAFDEKTPPPSPT